MTANGPGPEWTPRQREVLDLLAKGYTNGQIAERLGISLDGAKWHVSEILSKLQKSSRDEAAEYWRRENGLPARLARLSRGLAFGLPLRWAALGGLAVAAGLAVAVVVYIVTGNGEDMPASPGDESTPTPTSTESPTPPPDGVERWGNFALHSHGRPARVIEQEIPAELEDFGHEPGDDPWLSPLAHYIEGPDEDGGSLPRISSRPPGMDFVVGALITDGLKIPEAVTFYAESSPELEELSLEERLALAREGDGFTLHATRLYTLPVYVEVADGPTESTPGVTAHPVEKVQVSANPAVLQRFEGLLVERGQHPRTVVRWFGQDIAYEAHSPFDADLTLALVQPDRLGAAWLTTEPAPGFEAHPLSVRTGDESVDIVLAALERGDRAEVESLLLFEPVPCSLDQEGLGAPPECPEGAADSTPVEVLPVGNCEGGWLYRDGASRMATMLADGVDGVLFYPHSVVLDQDEADFYYLLLGNGLGWSLTILEIRDSRIGGYFGGCGLTAENIAQQWGGAVDFLLPPPSYGPFVYVSGADTCLFVREEPATDAAPLECIPEGAPLRDLDEAATDDSGRDWFAVQTLSGFDGWAAAEFLAPPPDWR